MRVTICLAIVLLVFSLAQADVELSGISISRQGDSIFVDINTSASTEYEHSLIEDAPQRIVVDLKGTVNNWPQQKFESLPLKSIERVRTSQYQVTPEFITRVVLDVNRPLTYNISSLDSGVRVGLLAVIDEAMSVTWSAQGSSEGNWGEETTPPTRVTEQEIEQAGTAESEVELASAETEVQATPAEPSTDSGSAIEPRPGEAVGESEPEVAESETGQIPTMETEMETDPRSSGVMPAEETVEKRPSRVEVESLPTRKVVTYKAGSERDPFKALIGAGGKNVLSGGIPNVENLSLVGVFEDETGIRALFEDAEGNGFLLSPNDRVQNGYLVAIQKNKAIFQVTEYGWTRTVALSLKMPE